MCILALFTFNCCAEREQCKLHYFKALQTAGYAYYGYAVSYSAEEVHESERPASEQKPQDICDWVRRKAQGDFFAVWHKREPCCLKTFDAEWDSYDSYTEDNSSDAPEQCKQESAEDYPYKV